MLKIEIGSAQRPCLGERVCGDAFVVIDEGEYVTIAVADGLGHGEAAALAATAFCAHVEEQKSRSIEDIMNGAQSRLAGTRGAAAALLRFDTTGETVEYVGVGNIETAVVGDSPVRPVSSPGIVGKRVRKLLCFTYDIGKETMLVVFSDGISSRMDLCQYAHLEPQALAERILVEYGKDYDDATCVVVRC